MSQPFVDPAARRRVLRVLAGAAAGAATPAFAADTLACAESLLPPAPAQGFLARLRLDGAPITLAARRGTGVAGAGVLEYAVRHRGRDYLNPTLVVRQGERVKITLDNRLAVRTNVHWHGIANDTRNDGGVTAPVAPRSRFDYAFEVRNRAGLYWYHPHPHGATAEQVHNGLYGLLEVEDPDDDALRRDLDLVPGVSEFALVVRDTAGARPYVADAAALVHGFLGDAPRVNGVACPATHVGTRAYRLRLLNACNARTLLVGFRSGSTPVPFHVIGNDGGLLPAPVQASAAFLGAAERIDVLLDLRNAAVGDVVVLETRAFDPMHADIPDEGAAHAAEHQHDGPTAAEHQGHGAAWPEGTARDLLALRVARRTAYDRTLPRRLAALSPIDTTGARERPLRLGWKSGHWRINDRVYVMGATPIEVARDSTEVWLLRNYHTSMPHAMHLHGFGFEVLERETPPDAVQALAVDARNRVASDLGRKDTVLVWPGESVRIAIRFAMPYPDPQTYLFHCHNLEHGDGGMMLGVRVA